MNEINLTSSKIYILVILDFRYTLRIITGLDPDIICWLFFFTIPCKPNTWFILIQYTVTCLNDATFIEYSLKILKNCYKKDKNGF